MHDVDILPEIEYEGWKIKDISRRFVIKYIESKKSKPYWFKHRITGWKSIENVAYDFYGSCDYIWAVMIANNIVHPVKDWLKKPEEVYAEAQKKYGAEFLTSPHHYEYNGIRYTTRNKTITDARKTPNASGHVIPEEIYRQVLRTAVNPLHPIFVGDIDVVTNIEWEMEQNEKKRIINLIYPTLLSELEPQMEKLF